MDAFYKDTHECPRTADGTVHWDLPESLHLDEVFHTLMEIKEGHDVFMPVYDRGQCRRTGETVFSPRPIVFAEGMQLYADPRIRNLFDLRLWLEVPEEVAIQRRLKRQPDYDLHYYKTVALPSQRETVVPLKVHSHATINGDRSLREIAMDTDRIIQSALEI